MTTENNIIKKACASCKITKLLCEFHKSKGGKYGKRSECITCVNFKSRENYATKISLKPKMPVKLDKICSICGVLKLLNCFGNGKNQCKICSAARIKVWREENKEYCKMYRHTNKQKIKEDKQKWRERNKNYYQEYYLLNKEKVKNKNKKWESNNKKKRRNRKRERIKNDIVFKVVCNIRTRLNAIIHHKTKRSLDLIGCSPEWYMKNISNQFTPEMTWNNIHVDHIIPFNYFNMQNEKEQLMACHWTNTRPMLISDNLSKGTKLPEDFNKRKWKGKDIGWIVEN